MLQLGYFEIAYNEDNHLKVTESGRKILFGQEKAMLVVIRRDKEETKKKGQRKKSVEKERPLLKPELREEDDDLFEILRAHRKKLADEQGYPAYIVLSDKVLHLLCSIRPTTVEAFGNISGIGDFKREKYGDGFVSLIRKYLKKQ